MGRSRTCDARPRIVAGALALACMLIASLSPANLLEGSAGRNVVVTLTQGTNMAAAAAPNGTTLVLGIQGSLWRLPAAGGQATRLTNWEIEATQPVWSPDGTRIAFQSFAPDGYYHIYTMNADGSNVQAVTSGPYDDREPTWSPDGTRIAFSSDRAENNSYDIWSVNVASGALQQWTNLTTNEFSPAWSPDGSRIAYVDGRFVYAIDAGGQRTQLASIPSGTIRVPAWLPNGAGVVYQNNARQIVLNGQAVTSGEDIFPFPVTWLPDGSFLYTADGRIRVRNADGSNPREIAFSADLEVRRPVRQARDHGFDDPTPHPVKGIYSPVLSPDGNRVAFSALNDLWVMEIGGTPRRLTNDTYVDWNPSWSSDGRLFFASDRHGNGRQELYHVDLGSGALTRMSVTPATILVVDPVVAPDGRSFAYINGVNQSLRVHDFASGQSRLVANQAYASNVGKPSWSPDGQYVAMADIRRANTRFREGRNLIRIVNIASGTWTFHEPGPLPSQLSERFEAGPAWSPDGKWLAFIMDSTLHVIPVGPSGTPAGPSQQLTQHTADMPAWGGAAGTIVYMSNGELRSIQVDGTNARSIPVNLTWRHAMPAGRTVIHAGGLWDAISSVLQPNMGIVLEGATITQVAPIAQVQRLAGDRFIDASHLTVMPGLWDTHVHPRVKDYTSQWWAVQLAFGFTGVTSNGVSTYTTMMQHEALNAGQLVGPRLFTAPIYDGNRVYYGHHRAMRNADILALELGKARALGMDFYKAYVRNPPSLMAIVAQAAQQAGVASGTHFLSPGIQTGLGGTTHLSATQRMGYSWSDSAGGVSYQDVVDLYSKGEFYLTSTHGGTELLGDDPALLNDPRFLLLMPPNYVNGLRTDIATPPTPAERANAAESVVQPTAILRGGGLVALGTDTPLSEPALGLHGALRAFSLGVSNHEALQSATINAARYSHADHELGTVEAGKIADLIMVRGNPLADVANAARVEIVMKNGLTHSIADILRPFSAAGAAQLVPDVLNLRTMNGVVAVVLTVPAEFDLRTWTLGNIRMEGAAAQSAAASSDGRTLVATFRKSDLGAVVAGNAVNFTVTGTLSRTGEEKPFVASATGRVLR